MDRGLAMDLDFLPTVEQLLDQLTGTPRAQLAQPLVVAPNARGRRNPAVRPVVTAQVAIPIPIVRDTMQLSKLISETLLWLDSRELSPDTRLNYGVAYQQFIVYLNSLGLTDDARHFDQPNVVGFQKWMHQRGMGSATINARLSALAAMAEHGAMLRDGRGRPVVPVNPLAGLRRPKKKKPPEKFLLPPELRAFLTAGYSRPLMRDRVAVALLMDVGARRAELCAARFVHLVEIGGTTSIQLTVKGGETVALPLSPHVARLLFEWRIERNMPDPGEPILIDRDGQRLQPDALCSLIKRIGQKALITRFPVTPHVIRHTLEVIRRRRKIDPTVRSKLMAHSSLASLSSYQHTLPDELVEARQQQVEELDRYIGGPLDYTPGLSAEAPPGDRNCSET
jgi:integrase